MQTWAFWLNGMLRQRDHKIKASLDYIVRSRGRKGTLLLLPSEFYMSNRRALLVMPNRHHCEPRALCLQSDREDRKCRACSALYETAWACQEAAPKEKHGRSWLCHFSDKCFNQMGMFAWLLLNNQVYLSSWRHRWSSSFLHICPLVGMKKMKKRDCFVYKKNVMKNLILIELWSENDLDGFVCLGHIILL